MLTDNFSQGMLSCARYAFAPNFYQYCGPDKNKTIKDYLAASQADKGLMQILSDFEVLHPYLSLIAHSNKISNPFDWRVVEAYWLGNSLLENVQIKDFYQHLLDEQQLAKKYSKKALDLVIGNLPYDTKVHHSFHVFNLFRRTGHLPINHTLQTMDNCRVGWGRIIKTQNSKFKIQNCNVKLKINKQFDHLAIQPFTNKIVVLTQPLTFQNSQLTLGRPVQKNIIDQFNPAKNLKVGDWVSFHWGFLGEKLTVSQVKNLQYYTRLSLKLANLFIYFL